MGQLIQKLKDAGQPTDEIKASLGSALKQRNRLAHKYFAEQAISFMSEAGRNTMIAELESIQEQFRSVASMIDAITMEVARRYGITDEMQRKAREEFMANQGKHTDDD